MNTTAKRMKTKVPARKVWSGALVGALVTVGVFLANAYGMTPKPIPAEVATALTTILSFAVGYIVPPSSIDEIVPREAKMEPVT